MSPVLDFDSLVLKAGAHDQHSREMCVMEATAYLAGEPWSDHPVCASLVIAAFLRSYNDSVSEEVRQTLKQFIPRLIGTAASREVEERRSLMAADWLVRVHTPAWLRLAGLTANAEALEALPEITSMAQIHSIKESIEAARRAAGAAARDAAWAAARAAAGAAAGDAAGTAAWDAAGDAARDAAGAAAWAAAWDAAGAAAWDAAWAAAGAKLRPVVETLQASIPALIEKMIGAK